MNDYSFFTKMLILFGLYGLTSCASQSDQNTLNKLQNHYNYAVYTQQHYQNGNYGKPDPAAFLRLQHYQSEAWQGIISLRNELNTNKQLSSQTVKNSENAINNYRSYLAALGATSANRP